MADYTDNALLSSLKALEHAVQPALDPTDPLACEQLRLVMGFLAFQRSRLPLWYPRRWFELDHQLRLAREVVGEASLFSEELATRLHSAITAGEQIQAQRLPPVAQVDASNAELAACVSALVRQAAHGDTEARLRLQRTVLRSSKRWVDMQRAWFAPQGFELRADELPPLDRLLADAAERRD